MVADLLCVLVLRTNVLCVPALSYRKIKADVVFFAIKTETSACIKGAPACWQMWGGGVGRRKPSPVGSGIYGK